MKADVKQIIDLAVDLEKIAGGVGAKTAQVVRKSAADVEAQAKARAAVDTGNLRNSIGSDFTGDGRNSEMYADIGPTADYGAHVEFGTHRMGPQPYMMPAADAVTPSFVAAVEKVVDL
jgi:HK97 gp10 family phage protein